MTPLGLFLGRGVEGGRDAARRKAASTELRLAEPRGRSRRKVIDELAMTLARVAAMQEVPDDVPFADRYRSALRAGRYSGSRVARIEQDEVRRTMNLSRPDIPKAFLDFANSR